MRGSNRSGAARRALTGLCGCAVALAVTACDGGTILEGVPIGVPGGGDTSSVASTIHRSWGGTIDDLAVDADRGLVYVSVIDRNEIEVLDYLEGRRVGQIPVGSQPAGLFLDRTGDTLIVANSGGTSLSMVDLEGGEESFRLETHNAVLYNIDQDVGDDEQSDSTVIETLTFWEDYGDRPQRVVQDSSGVIFYSTAGGGPIRMVESYPSYESHEANIMLWSDVLVADSANWAVTYVDSMIIEPESIFLGGSTLVVWDHVAGRPDQTISARGGPADVGAILGSLRAQGSDVFYVEGASWSIDYWNVGEQTHFATSADGSTVAIGDDSRVWTWQAKGAHPGYVDRIISSYISIGDLTTNGLTGLNGLAVDQTGLQLAAKGGGSVLYFNHLLRLHGSHTIPTLDGEGGLARHPTEPWAFAATNERSVLVLEATGHYRVLAELPVGENLVGPLRFSMPRADDDPELLGRLHGVTAAGDVVTILVWQEMFS